MRRPLRISACRSVWSWAVMLLTASHVFAGTPYHSEPGQFQVNLPEPPVIKQVELSGGDAPATLQFQHSVRQPDGGIIVWYQDARHITDVDAALSLAAATIVKQAKGPIIESHDLDVGGFPARYVSARIPGLQGVFRSQTVYAHGRLYQINVVGTEAFAASPVANEVFRSFAVTTPTPEKGTLTE